MNAKRINRGRGTGLMESTMGGLFIVTVALFFLDLFAVCQANSTLDRVTFSAARAASVVEPAQAQPARQAAEAVIKECQQMKPIVRSIKITEFQYPNAQRVEVSTEMVVSLPAPLPALPRQLTFKARSIQPIVSVPPIKY